MEQEEEVRNESKLIELKPTPEDDGKPTKFVKRTVFFQGAAFIIEEEVSVGSEDEESVNTSDDDFHVDDAVVKKDYRR